MPITTTITHTRPNALVSWYPQTEVFITRMNAFQSAGYITSWNVDQSQELVSMVTIVYPNGASKARVESDTTIDAFYQAMLSYHNDYGITQSRTED